MDCCLFHCHRKKQYWEFYSSEYLICTKKIVYIFRFVPNSHAGRGMVLTDTEYVEMLGDRYLCFRYKMQFVNYKTVFMESFII